MKAVFEKNHHCQLMIASKEGGKEKINITWFSVSTLSAKDKKLENKTFYLYRKVLLLGWMPDSSS